MTNQPTIFRSLAVQSGFSKANPIDFELLDDEGRQQIYILNDQSPGRMHHLVLANESGQDLTFQKDNGNRIPSRANHHFEVRFRPGTLSAEHSSWLTIGTGGWRLAVEERSEEGDNIHDGTMSLYLLFVGEEELVLPAGRTIVLILHHVKAGIAGGSRGSRMELRYQTDGQQLLTTPADSIRCYRQERLQIINNRGKKELPMIAAFEGSSTVLNDGATENHLILQISNFLQNDTIALSALDSESPTKFILSFDTSKEQAAWALCDNDNAQAIDVEVHFEKQEATSWRIRPEFQGNNPQWVITLLDDVEVAVGEYFHLHLEGLKTSMPSGFTKLYLLYENIPGFWDGRFEILIEKSPLKFDDEKQDKNQREDGHFIQKTKVGIGNTKPVDTLDVNGGVQAETLVLRNGLQANLALDVKGKINALDSNIEGKFSTKDLEVTGNLKVAGTLQDDLGHFIPPGGIIMWSGTKVPTGWKLCDGTNDTPDLKGRFIVGYQKGVDDYNQPGNFSEGGATKGNTSGESHVTLSINQMPVHEHGFVISFNDKYTDLAPRAYRDTDGSHQTGENLTTATSRNLSIRGVTDQKGGNASHENRPPYYVLAFIMKK